MRLVSSMRCMLAYQSLSATTVDGEKFELHPAAEEIIGVCPMGTTGCWTYWRNLLYDSRLSNSFGVLNDWDNFYNYICSISASSPSAVWLLKIKNVRDAMKFYKSHSQVQTGTINNLMDLVPSQASSF